jgi:DNA invertase Pin-like site-specific DNA recombinase
MMSNQNVLRAAYYLRISTEAQELDNQRGEIMPFIERRGWKLVHPFEDVMISMFATLAKEERARISERTIAGIRVARAKGKRLGRPPLPEETVRTVLSLNQDAGIGARKIAKSTGFPLGTVSAILTRSRQQACWLQP